MNLSDGAVTDAAADCPIAFRADPLLLSVDHGQHINRVLQLVPAELTPPRTLRLQQPANEQERHCRDVHNGRYEPDASRLSMAPSHASVTVPAGQSVIFEDERVFGASVPPRLKGRVPGRRRMSPEPRLGEFRLRWFSLNQRGNHREALAFLDHAGRDELVDARLRRTAIAGAPGHAYCQHRRSDQ